MKRLLTVLMAALVLLALFSEGIVQDRPCLAAMLLGCLGLFSVPGAWRRTLVCVAVFLLLAAAQFRSACYVVPTCLVLTALFLLSQLVPRRWCLTLLTMACGGFLSLQSAWLVQPRESGGVAFLQRGGWGVSLPHDDSLTISSQYSYDVIKTFLRSHDIETPMQLGAEDAACWIITPTHPVSAEEAGHLLRWVEEGGCLYLVTDHTNLFGHRDALAEIWSRSGILCRDDVVIRECDEPSYLAPDGCYEGLSANTLGGCGEPFLWQCGYRERADYMGRCFFSDNQVSDEDEWGVFPAGLVTKYGRGRIVTMADSTLFSNFALAFPASQALLAATIQARPFPLRLMAGLLFLLLPLLRRFPRASALLFFGGAVAFAVWPRAALSTSLPTVSVAAAPASFHGPHACALAAAYAASPSFPLWGQGGTTTLPPLASREQAAPWRETLFSPTAPDIEDLTARCMQAMAVQGVWFDNGVGLLREHTARDFWRRVCHAETAPLALESPRFCSVQYLVDGKVIGQGACRITPFRQNPDWLVIGSAGIGRMVDTHTILLKKEWQLPHAGAEDALLLIQGDGE